MVDSTVPDWKAKPGDLYWDHHRPEGADVQMDEIPVLSPQWWMPMLAVQLPVDVLTPETKSCDRSKIVLLCHS
ncbi:MAG: hypothetical protein SFY66_07575 [Oculatellaceae cyanobacterium bins.114]|nr:hypothetical protein [Oculatellaceae cyanobacterium bins.114]